MLKILRASLFIFLLVPGFCDPGNNSSEYDEFIRLRETIARELQRIRYRVARTTQADVRLLRDIDYKLSRVLSGNNEPPGNGSKLVRINGLIFEGPWVNGTFQSSKIQARRNYDRRVEKLEDDLRDLPGNPLLSFEPGIPVEEMVNDRVRILSRDGRIVLKKRENQNVQTVSLTLSGERQLGSFNSTQVIAWRSYERTVQDWLEQNRSRLNNRFLLSASSESSDQVGGEDAFQYQREWFLKFLLNPGEEVFEQARWIQGPEISGHFASSWRLAYQRYIREYEEWVDDQNSAGSPLLYAGPGNMESIVTDRGVSFRSKAKALLLLR